MEKIRGKRREGEEGEREGKMGSTFSLRSTELGWSSRVRPRLKVGVLVKGNAWTPKLGVFIGDLTDEFGKSKVSGFKKCQQDFLDFILRSKR